MARWFWAMSKMRNMVHSLRNEKKDGLEASASLPPPPRIERVGSSRGGGGGPRGMAVARATRRRRAVGEAERSASSSAPTNVTDSKSVALPLSYAPVGVGAVGVEPTTCGRFAALGTQPADALLWQSAPL